MNDNKLLREYSRKYLKSLRILREYGDQFSDFQVEPDDLKKIFVSPFKDVLSISKGSLSKISSRALNTAEVLTKGLLATIIPAFSVHYEEIFDKERKRRQKVEAKYREIFEKNREYLFGNDEAKLLSFMLNPALYLTSYAVYQVPKQALETSGFLLKRDKYSQRRIKQALGTIEKAFEKEFGKDVMPRSAKKSSINKDAFGEAKMNIFARLLNEQKPNDEMVQQALEVLNDERVQQALQNSPIVRGLKRDAERMVDETIKDIQDEVNNLNRIRNIEEMGNIIGRDVEKELRGQNIPEEELKQAKEVALKQVKSSVLGTYLKLAQKNLEEFKSLKLPDELGLVKKWERLVSEIGTALKRVG